MGILEIIKTEIERLKNQLIRGACAAQIEMETNCKDEAYNEVLAFLDTLPEQPVEGLEEAAREYAKEYTKNEGNGGDDWEDDIRITFEAGAEWQKEKTAWVYLKEAKDAVIALEKEKGEPLNPRVAFVNGARWQKQQMLEEAVEGTVCKDESDVWIEIRPDALPNFKDMQPVKLIVKEDVE